MSGLCSQCCHQENIMGTRKPVRECLEKQARKMLKLSTAMLQPVEIGTTVRVSIPDVDRARGAPGNILAVVTHIENDLYRLCMCTISFLPHAS